MLNIVARFILIFSLIFTTDATKFSQETKIPIVPYNDYNQEIVLRGGLYLNVTNGSKYAIDLHRDCLKIGLTAYLQIVPEQFDSMSEEEKIKLTCTIQLTLSNTHVSLSNLLCPSNNELTERSKATALSWNEMVYFYFVDKKISFAITDERNGKILLNEFEYLGETARKIKNFRLFLDQNSCRDVELKEIFPEGQWRQSMDKAKEDLNKERGYRFSTWYILLYFATLWSLAIALMVAWASPTMHLISDGFFYTLQSTLANVRKMRRKRRMKIKKELTSSDPFTCMTAEEVVEVKGGEELFGDRRPIRPSEEALRLVSEVDEDLPQEPKTARNQDEPFGSEEATPLLGGTNEEVKSP